MGWKWKNPGLPHLDIKDRARRLALRRKKVWDSSKQKTLAKSSPNHDKKKKKRTKETKQVGMLKIEK